MKTILLYTAIIIAAVNTAAANSLDAKADSAYTADDFTTAANLYSKIISEQGSSPQLYYNLGNSYYRLGKLGKAIVNYERALRIDPQFEEAKTNLEFVNSRIYDKPGERGSFLSNTFHRFATIATANTLAWSAFTLFVLTLSAIALYYFSPIVSLRKYGFFGAIILFLLFIATIILAIKAKHIANDNDTAIIISPSAMLSTSPREPKDRREEAMILHEGTKLHIIDSISATADTAGLKWLDVQIDNHHRAWIKSTDIERI